MLAIFIKNILTIYNTVILVRSVIKFLDRKKLSFCNKLQFSNPYIFAT